MESRFNRIIDANFNRSREALRVMEEFARFVLDDATLTQAIKTARHDLTAAIQKLSRLEREGGHGPPYMEDAMKASSAPEGPGFLATGEVQGNPWSLGRKNCAAPAGAGEPPLALHRDIVGDVGTGISTPTEIRRSSEIDVLSAACKRLSESLRVLEEYGKTIDTQFAAAIEQLRYGAYELERRLLATIYAREKFAHMRLYVLITESLCRGDWFETARAALEGGADCLQLREKQLPDRELLDRAKKLAQLCRDMQKTCIINDRPDIALAAGAHGVHLGQDDLPVAAARRMLPVRMIVGLSTHTMEQVDAAIALAPDYIAVGPMFDSATKPQKHLARPELLAEARKRTALPLVAIGGIEDKNITRVWAAGATCVCVCRSVIAQADPAKAVRRFLDLMKCSSLDSSSSENNPAS